MSTFNTTTNTTPNFDNLLLQSLLNRLQITSPQPPPPHQPPSPQPSTTTFDDFLSSHLFSDSELDDFNFDFDYPDDDDDDDEELVGGVSERNRSRLSKEESKLEKEIVKVILTGKTGNLKPNSGQAVSIGDHHVCVGFHDGESGSGYRVWEWHGHVMLFDEDLGYTPEYIYGNYFERVSVKVVGGGKKDSKEKKGQNCNLGLRELIGDDAGVVGRSTTRVIHSSRNAGSPSVLKGSSEN